jgi:hypothetical protein
VFPEGNLSRLCSTINSEPQAYFRFNESFRFLTKGAITPMRPSRSIHSSPATPQRDSMDAAIDAHIAVIRARGSGITGDIARRVSSC